MEGFPEDPEPLRASLTRALELKGNTESLSLVKTADMSISHEGHDNWDGGIDYYGIRLGVTLETFARLESRIESLEKEILESARMLWRGADDEDISRVVVAPNGISPGGAAQVSTPLGNNLPAFWNPTGFRLFISHCASHKVQASGILEPCIDRSAAYIAGWLKALKNDQKLVVIAAAQAQKAALLHGSMLSADFSLPHPMVTALGSYRAFRDWSSC